MSANIRYTNGTRRIVMALLISAMLLVGIPMSAFATGTPTDGDGADLSNSVTITIRAGDANALAACLNVADESGYGSVNQTNKCKNTAKAVGGDLTLKNVTIDVFQSNSGDGDISNAENSVDLTIRAGDANALAACVNLAKEKKRGDAKQYNYCRNKVYARGGDLVLRNVDIIVTQLNGDE